MEAVECPQCLAPFDPTSAEQEFCQPCLDVAEEEKDYTEVLKVWELPPWTRTKAREELRARIRKALERGMKDKEFDRYWRGVKDDPKTEGAQEWLMDRFVEGLQGPKPGAPRQWYRRWGFRVPPKPDEGKKRGPRRYRCKWRFCREGGTRRRRPKLFDRKTTRSDPYCSAKCKAKQKRRYGWYEKRQKNGKLVRVEKRVCSVKDCDKSFFPTHLSQTLCPSHR